MDVITTKRSGLSQTQKDKIRQQRINNSRFDPKFMGEGGPVYMYQSCGFVTNKYRNEYDRIFGEQNIFKNLANREI